MYEEAAKEFIEAIKTFSEKPENLSNFECYLSHHFATWLSRRADTPENIAAEMTAFANNRF